MIQLPNSQRIFISPLANLTPQLLALQLDEFQAGHFWRVARTWDAIERRDDMIKSVAGKRKKAPAHLPWQVTTLDDSAEALAQKCAAEEMLNALSVTDASDKSVSGALPLLIEYLMDAVGKKYSCLEYRFTRDAGPAAPRPAGGTTIESPAQMAPPTPAEAAEALLRNARSVNCELQFVPLWFFQKINGELNFVDIDGNKTPLNSSRWIIAVGEGLMEASSIAYLYKHLPLRDWLIYCERNGMPGVKGTTSAQPGTPEWENAKRAVEEFGAEFSALLTAGASIEAIDLSSKGELPYVKLVDRMDRAIIVLWRGGDMTTLSGQRAGTSLQEDEVKLLEQYDAGWISETINAQLLRPFVEFAFGKTQKMLVSFSLEIPAQLDREIAIFTLLKNLNLPIPAEQVYERLGLEMPKDETKASEIEKEIPNETHAAK